MDSIGFYFPLDGLPLATDVYWISETVPNTAQCFLNQPATTVFAVFCTSHTCAPQGIKLHRADLKSEGNGQFKVTNVSEIKHKSPSHQTSITIVEMGSTGGRKSIQINDLPLKKKKVKRDEEKFLKEEILCSTDVIRITRSYSNVDLTHLTESLSHGQKRR